MKKEEGRHPSVQTRVSAEETLNEPEEGRDRQGTHTWVPSSIKSYCQLCVERGESHRWNKLLSLRERRT